MTEKLNTNKKIRSMVQDYEKIQRERIKHWLRLIAAIKEFLITPIGEAEQDEHINTIVQEWKQKSFSRDEEEKEKEQKYKQLIETLYDIAQQKEYSAYAEQLTQANSFLDAVKKKSKDTLVMISEIATHAPEDIRKDIEYQKKMHLTYKKLEKDIDEDIRYFVKDHPLWTQHLKGVKGIAELSAAYIIAGLSIKPLVEWRTPSQIWRYSGLDVVDGKAPRKERGKVLHFNATFRSHLLKRVGDNLLKQKGGYYEKYLEYKERAERKENPRPHKTAMRKMVKLLLSHVWEKIGEIYEVEGRGKPYVIDILGHSNYIPPILDKPEVLASYQPVK